MILKSILTKAIKGIPLLDVGKIGRVFAMRDYDDHPRHLECLDFVGCTENPALHVISSSKQSIDYLVGHPEPTAKSNTHQQTHIPKAIISHYIQPYSRLLLEE